MEISRLADQVYEIPGQLFYGEPVHSYLIDEESCLVVVDGPDPGDDTIAAIAAFGKPVKVVLTHGPTARGVERLRKALDAEVYLHEADQNNAWLTIDPRDCILWQGRQLEVGDKLTIVHTPGHSPGHSCLYYPRSGGMLFSGDAVQGDANGNIRDIWHPGTDWSLARNLASLRMLVNRFRFEMILPFHYHIVPAAGSAKLLAALDQGISDST